MKKKIKEKKNFSHSSLFAVLPVIIGKFPRAQTHTVSVAKKHFFSSSVFGIKSIH